MATVENTKDKLTGTKVRALNPGRTYVVDQNETSELYDQIIADEYPIPDGYMIILKNEDGDAAVKIGLGTPWSEAVTLVDNITG